MLSSLVMPVFGVVVGGGVGVLVGGRADNVGIVAGYTVDVIVTFGM